MKPHPRIRKTIKWGGLAVTVLLVVVWVGSEWRGAYWMARPGVGTAAERGFIAAVFKGRIAIGYWRSRGERKFPPDSVGLVRPELNRWLPHYVIDVSDWHETIPLWIPTLVTMCAGLAAWRLDSLARRRARLNLCPNCNYDRTGLASGAQCPECGSRGTPA